MYMFLMFEYQPMCAKKHAANVNVVMKCSLKLTIIKLRNCSLSGNFEKSYLNPTVLHSKTGGKEFLELVLDFHEQEVLLQKRSDSALISHSMSDPLRHR